MTRSKKTRRMKMSSPSITIGGLDLDNLEGGLKFSGGSLIGPKLYLTLDLKVEAHAPIIGTKSKKLSLDIPMKIGTINLPTGGKITMSVPSGSLSVKSSEATIPLTSNKGFDMASIVLSKTSMQNVSVNDIMEALGIKIPSINLTGLQMTNLKIPATQIVSAINPSWSGSADTGKIGWGDLWVKIKVGASINLKLGGLNIKNVTGSMTGKSITMQSSNISVKSVASSKSRKG